MGIVATAEDVGKVADAIKKVTDLLKSLNVKRSAVLEVRNLTTKTLKLVSAVHADGGFEEPPSPEIPPGNVDIFGSHDEGVLPDARGRVSYESEDGFLLHVDWENSGSVFTGNVACDATLVSINPEPPNFQAKHICGTGDQAHMQFIVEPGLPLIPITRRREIEGERVSEIAVVSSGPQQLVTAVVAAPDVLKLLSWAVDPNDGSISRRGNNGDIARPASDIDIARGRLFVTACRTAARTLKLISWEIEPNGTARRRGEGEAGEASNIRIIALTDTLFVTAVKTGSGDLKLITWVLAPDNNLVRRGDSEEQAGEVQEIALVKISPDPQNGNHRVVTSVRAGNDDLVWITWSISPRGRTIQRISFDNGLAREASRIRSVFTPAGFLVTSVRSGSGDLVLITCTVADNGAVKRHGESHGQAGEISDNALMIQPGYILSAVEGGSGLKLIPWRISAQGAIERAGDSNEQAGGVLSGIVLCPERLIDKGPIITAVRTTNSNLKLISWTDQLD
jgi:hypothetical protein